MLGYKFDVQVQYQIKMPTSHSYHTLCTYSIASIHLSDFSNYSDADFLGILFAKKTWGQETRMLVLANLYL